MPLSHCIARLLFVIVVVVVNCCFQSDCSFVRHFGFPSFSLFISFFTLCMCVVLYCLCFKSNFGAFACLQVSRFLIFLGDLCVLLFFLLLVCTTLHSYCLLLLTPQHSKFYVMTHRALLLAISVAATKATTRAMTSTRNHRNLRKKANFLHFSLASLLRYAARVCCCCNVCKKMPNLCVRLFLLPLPFAYTITANSALFVVTACSAIVGRPNFV